MTLVIILILAIVIGLFVVTEVGLRLLFGFGNPLIYITDEKIGYLLAPNQRTRRFGNLILINEYSMRSPKIEKAPSPSTLRVLLLGDSIANGGWWTDQEQTISSLMNHSQLEVLNASANSWGPRNELAYLLKYGSFNAQAIVLLLNTDDLFATAPTSLPVGRDRNYANRKPPLALVEVFNRYISKPKPIPEMAAVYAEPGDRIGLNLQAIFQIQAFSREHNSQFLLAMTPLVREVGTVQPRDYEIKARQRLTDFTNAQQITYIDFLPIFNSTTDPKALYQDNIHLNLEGNKLVALTIEQVLAGSLNLINA